MKQEKCISWNPLTPKLQWHSWQSLQHSGIAMYCSNKNMRDIYKMTQKIKLYKYIYIYINIKKEASTKKERNRDWWFGSISLHLLLIFFSLSLLVFVTRLSYRHEVKEWGRQRGNTLYHEERDAGPPWHALHHQPPWPLQASTHEHTVYLHSICTVQIFTNCKQMTWLCSPECRYTHTHTHTHSLLYFPPASLPLWLCMCPVISPSAHNCPNLWCFFLQATV